jgi:hypothetical protein
MTLVLPTSSHSDLAHCSRECGDPRVGDAEDEDDEQVPFGTARVVFVPRPTGLRAVRSRSWRVVEEVRGSCAHSMAAASGVRETLFGSIERSSRHLVLRGCCWEHDDRGSGRCHPVRRSLLRRGASRSGWREQRCAFARRRSLPASRSSTSNTAKPAWLQTRSNCTRSLPSAAFQARGGSCSAQWNSRAAHTGSRRPPRPGRRHRGRPVTPPSLRRVLLPPGRIPRTSCGDGDGVAAGA